MRKLIIISFLIFGVNQLVNAQCRVEFDSGTKVEDYNFNNSHLPSETLTVTYKLETSSCPDDDVNAEFVDGDGPTAKIITEKDFPSWVQVSSFDAYSEKFQVTCLQNPTTNDRYYSLRIRFEDLGHYVGTLEVYIIQHPAKASHTWYTDTDGDGFGDFLSEPEISTSRISGKVNNNLDYCSNEFSKINNGCLEPYENRNWTRSESFDIKGNLLTSSKAYFDDLGKGTQAQTYERKNQRTWATQTLYDASGRPAFQTLSAPITDKNSAIDFKYKTDFIKKTDNSTDFTSADFETGVIENPGLIGNKKNSLGWYYSDANTDEKYQDKTDRPYSRTIYSTLNPGAVKQTIGGNKINGQWKQGYSFSMLGAQEMHYVFGYDAFEKSPAIKSTYTGIDAVLKDTNKQIVWLTTTKSVVEDVHGNEAVVFADTDGKTLAAARSGIPENPANEKQFEVLTLIGEQKYLDIHIPKGCENTASFLGSTSNYKVYDLKTEIAFSSTPSTLPAGFYRVTYTGTKTFTKASTLTYIDKGTGSIQPVESGAVGIRYKVNYYDFSLNEYNTAGNLMASLQPIGFNNACLNKLSPTVAHKSNLKSTFSYNSLGQLLSTTSPDEGTANFKYRKDGQIRFSQNSKQQLVNEFSYTNYDEFGRPIESGVNNTSNGGPPFHVLNYHLENNNFTGTRSEKQETIYDFLDTGSSAGLSFSLGSLINYYSPTFLAGNVVRTSNQNTTTWYSYDVYGRVTWMVQNIVGLGTKTIDYEYDPVTSQVLKVIYQKHNSVELFVHKYTYNTAQQLVQVETSTDNTTFTKHAEYEYYETGALKRVKLADGIQNIDYVYNLAGQLKGINHPDLTGPKNPNNDSTDLFGMAIDYYQGDYKRTNDFSFSQNSTNDQYNGNIKGISWNTKKTTIGNPVNYTYQYNKNNWLKEAIFSDNANSITTSTVPTDVTLNTPVTGTTNIKASNSITLAAGFKVSKGISFSAKVSSAFGGGAGDYAVSNITYDANGNIQTLDRNKNTENGKNEMDKLTYNYKTDKPNQLLQVADAVTTSTNANDIKTQTTKNNYLYNSIGQLVENKDEKVKYEYNASGLVTKVYYNNQLKVQFYYNDKGFRVQKDSYTGSVKTTTHYVRDASGSALAIYEDKVQKELPIYGASRLGVYSKQSNTSVYQLTDHLGNVRAVIAKQGTNAVALTQATDYYPFGMPMPGRQIVGGQPYRYAYQGQEKDPETGKEAFQLRLWDSRIGRWLTTDPAGQYSSPYLGMGNNPVNGIDPDGAFWQEFGNWLSGNGWNTNAALDFQANGGVLGDWVGNKFTGYRTGYGNGETNEITIAVFRAKDDFKGNTSIFIWDKTHGKDVGHTAIKIDNYVFGFYPTDVNGNYAYDKGELFKSPGELKIDNMTKFKEHYLNESVNFWDLNVTKEKAQKLVTKLITVRESPPNYSLLGMQCTTVADKCLRDSGIDIADTMFNILANQQKGILSPNVFAKRLSSMTNKHLIKLHGKFIVK